MSKTDDLVEKLVSDLKPVSPRAFPRGFMTAISVSLGISLLLMLTVAGLRVDFPGAFMLPAFWIKSAYNFLIATAALAAVYRIARPDGQAGPMFREVGAVVALMALAAVLQLALSPNEVYRRLILGHSALRCPFLIVAFALPIFAAVFWWMRSAAPPDPRLAGLVSGLAAGAAGAWVYSWFCTENGMPFVLIWYSLGILLTGLIGRLLGPRLLRW
jgi:hypothetical protein